MILEGLVSSPWRRVELGEVKRSQESWKGDIKNEPPASRLLPSRPGVQKLSFCEPVHYDFAWTQLAWLA